MCIYIYVNIHTHVYTGLDVLANALLRNTTLRALHLASNGLTDQSLISSCPCVYLCMSMCVYACVYVCRVSLQCTFLDGYCSTVQGVRTGLR